MSEGPGQAHHQPGAGLGFDQLQKRSKQAQWKETEPQGVERVLHLSLSGGQTQPSPRQLGMDTHPRGKPPLTTVLLHRMPFELPPPQANPGRRRTVLPVQQMEQDPTELVLQPWGRHWSGPEVVHSSGSRRGESVRLQLREESSCGLVGQDKRTVPGRV